MHWTIYEIRNHTLNKSYIGSSTNIKRRMIIHRCSNKHFFKGKVSIILWACGKTKKEASYLESYFVKELNTIDPFGFNKTSGGYENFTQTEATKKLISKTLKTIQRDMSYMNTQEFKEHCLRALEKARACYSRKGTHHTLETKLKISKANKNNKYWVGKNHKEESKLKMSQSKKGIIPWNLGKKHSQETIEKIKQSKKGSIPWNIGKKWSLEKRKKLSESHKGQIPWNKGITHSEETRKLISERLKGKTKGRKRSPESVQKMLETKKRLKLEKLNSLI